MPVRGYKKLNSRRKNYGLRVNVIRTMIDLNNQTLLGEVPHCSRSGLIAAGIDKTVPLKCVYRRYIESWGIFETLMVSVS